VVASLVIIYGLPRLTRAVPSPLIAIVGLTAVAMVFGIEVPTVGDKGELPDALPSFLLPDIPWNLETLLIILPVSLTLTVV
ncbi:sodium-independent anion transporter, partial [Klebsiella pneumoniae]|nr:sodium-independent anion transporter [Klebsiella pneumoniae]